MDAARKNCGARAVKIRPEALRIHYIAGSGAKAHDAHQQTTVEPNSRLTVDSSSALARIVRKRAVTILPALLFPLPPLAASDIRSSSVSRSVCRTGPASIDV
jgi:hypothetical protein